MSRKNRNGLIEFAYFKQDFHSCRRRAGKTCERSTVRPGHDDVEDNKVSMCDFLDSFESVVGGRYPFHFMAAEVEARAQNIHGQVIVNDSNA